MPKNKKDTDKPKNQKATSKAAASPKQDADTQKPAASDEKPDTTTSAPPPNEQAPQPTPPTPHTPSPSQPPSTDTTPTLEDLHRQFELLKNLVFEHNQQIIELQQTVARKRKRVPNGKVKIKDTKTGEIFPSKNNAYQSLLKAGELKSLVDKGIFGDVPEKNTFGWYSMVREMPDRFVEVTDEDMEKEAGKDAGQVDQHE